MLDIAVIGGSSPTTPIFVVDLAKAMSGARRGDISLRLHGRDEQRLERIVEYAKIKLNGMEAGVGQHITVRSSIELPEVVRGADIIVCQVRPGGMRFRGVAESIAIAEGLPGDEGLGPGGLACYLRGRPELDDLFSVIAKHAPNALLLMMTSPLGLAVGRARMHAGLDCIGVCELSHWTIDRLISAAMSRLGLLIKGASVFGLNHASWIYDFRDQSGQNVTGEIIESGIAADIVDIDADVIRREQAVPVRYLRQIYHTRRVLREQNSRTRTRGAELADWRARAHAELTRPGRLREAELDAILTERRADWYSQGLVPAILAFTGNSLTTRILNVVSPGAGGDAAFQAVVEVPCRVGRMRASAMDVRPLPSRPFRVFRDLLEFERLSHRLPGDWTASDLVDVLMSHPSISRPDTARRLAHNIYRAVATDLEGSPAAAH